MGVSSITSDTLRVAVQKWADVFEKHKEELCDLDAKAGDGDHGLTISKGMNHAAQEVQNLPEDESVSNIFYTIGRALMRNMGGASGPIFSVFFIQASNLTKQTANVDLPLLKDILAKTSAGLTDLVEVQFGDKTMYDVIYRVLEEAQHCLDEGTSFVQAMNRLNKAGQKAALETSHFVAKKGRAKYLGERSKGFPDAGAMSMSYLFSVLFETALTGQSRV